MSSPGPASPLVLTLRGVSKAFGAVQALRDVTVDCQPGEIHALVGENGSGKSTLLGIASGFVHPDGGSVEIGGQPRRRGSPAEARKLGLGIAYQTYSHVRDLSVAENLYLSMPRSEAPPYGRMEDWAAQKLAEFKLEVSPGAPVGALSLAERQLLEVGLAVSGLQGERFGPVDLEVAKGEILGIAGAEGNGQIQFLRAIAGAERATGSATCNGRELDRHSPLGPLRAGVVLLSGDRV